jgi:ATP-dependent DNA helicase DinG
VPGDALRLLAFDRVPWPRPTILHRSRKKHFGGRRYDEALTRQKLKQAYGRLIRSESDRGVFVMLDSALPTRLHDAFPPDVVPQRLSLAQAVKEIESFFA